MDDLQCRDLVISRYRARVPHREAARADRQAMQNRAFGVS
jgi:hypothetical protein